MKQRVRSLLDEITDLNSHEVVATCNHCKQANPLGKCNKCDKLTSLSHKVTCCNVKDNQNKQERFKSWLRKINNFLRSILECEVVCRHERLIKSPPLDEFEKLLQQLKSPLAMRQPEIDYFPNVECGQFIPVDSMAQSKQMLQKALDKLTQRIQDASPSSNKRTYYSNSVSRHEKQWELGKKTLEPPTMSTSEANEKNKNKDAKVKSKLRKSQPKVLKSKLKKTKEENDTSTLRLFPKEAITSKLTSYSDENNSLNKINEKDLLQKNWQIQKISPSDNLLRQLIKADKILKQNEKNLKPMKLDSLPQIKMRIKPPSDDNSLDSIVVCDNPVSDQCEMIKGTRVIPLRRFNVEDEPLPDIAPLSCNLEDTKENYPYPSTPTKTKPMISSKVNEAGVIRYALSNREFIDKGWTILPSLKIMRSVNIYKMQPARLRFDWFQRHKNKTIFYNSGEKLAETSVDGHGKWFYKNGTVALHFYHAEETNAGHRTIVYSSGEDVVNGHKEVRTVLASFDSIGNGVVYGKCGNERLKYNQFEGVLYDEKVGPPSRWQWHSLNDPPELHPVCVETFDRHIDPALKKLAMEQQDEIINIRQSQPDMQAIEFEKFIKRKANKILQSYKPFQIRMKALKINNQFSLRVMDQSNIYLLFRDGNICFKHNLGMILRNSNIIDSDMAELGDVITPYDKLPSKSQSIANIQETVNRAKKLNKVRAKTAS